MFGENDGKSGENDEVSRGKRGAYRVLDCIKSITGFYNTPI